MSREVVEIDCYHVLEVSQSASLDEIKKSYRRLCFLRHPDKDIGNPDATQAFVIVYDERGESDVPQLKDAFGTIGSADTRRSYDLRYPQIKLKREAALRRQEEQKQTAQREQKGREQKAQREQQTAKEAAAANTALENRLRSKRLDLWQVQFERKKLETQQQLWAKEEAERLAKERSDNGWIAYIFGRRPKQPELGEDEKRVAEQERLQMEATKRIKREQLAKKRKEEQRLEEDISRLKSIMQETERKQKEEKARRIREEMLRQAAEQAARDREEGQRAQQRWNEELQEILRKRQAAAAQADAAREREAQRAEAERKMAEEFMDEMLAREPWKRPWYEDTSAAAYESAAPERRTYGSTSYGSTSFKESFYNSTSHASSSHYQTQTEDSSACRHRGWWPTVQGPNECGSCGVYYKSWILQCPGCEILACAKCRSQLRYRGR